MTRGNAPHLVPHRPRILVVHGALGSSAQMEPVRLALHTIGDAECVELPGHGNTPLAPGAEFGMPLFVGHLQETVTRVTRESGTAPLVFGYSMGGYVALALEAANPGALRGIVTLGTKFAWSPAVAERESGRLNPAVIAEKVPRFAALLQERHMAAGGWEAVLQHTASLLMQLGQQPVLTAQSMRPVAAAVCVAAGALDDTVSADECAQYAGYVPRGNAAVISGAPHPIERVPSDEIVRLMRSVVESELPAANEKEA